MRKWAPCIVLGLLQVLTASAVADPGAASPDNGPPTAAASAAPEDGSPERPVESAQAAVLQPFEPSTGTARWFLHDWYPFVGASYFLRQSRLESPEFQHGVQLQAGYADFWEVEGSLRLGLVDTEETIALLQNDDVSPAHPLWLGVSVGLLGYGRSSFSHRIGLEPSFGLWTDFRLGRFGGDSAVPSTLPFISMGPYVAVTSVTCGPRFRATFVPVTVGFGNEQQRTSYVDRRLGEFQLAEPARQLLTSNLKRTSVSVFFSFGVDWAIGRRRNTCSVL